MDTGKHQTSSFKNDDKGRFKRQQAAFRQSVTADDSSGFQAEPGRYHLYVSYACPWAHRTLIMRKLKGLEKAISLSVVDPIRNERGWAFTDNPGCTSDPIMNAQFLGELYDKANPDYNQRYTVPVLWDRKRETIVNNESREIIRMLDREFDDLAENKVDLCPRELEEKVDEVIDAIYQPINNGVYKSGFASTQEAYEEAVTPLFEALDHWEEVLANQRYLCGNTLTEADICMFTTLIRFDVVYVTHFKCNIRRIVNYPQLWNYLRDIYQHQGIKETCNFDHIKRHYFVTHTKINPHGIVPLGPIIDFDEPHDRNRFSG